nr:hypothetical protein Itr_chr10CG01080 [Ipomoea trifida]
MLRKKKNIEKEIKVGQHVLIISYPICIFMTLSYIRLLVPLTSRAKVYFRIKKKSYLYIVTLNWIWHGKKQKVRLSLQ